MTGATASSAPEVDVRVVAGTARVDDLDAFLAEVNAVREATGAVVQVFDAQYVVSRRHLVRAVELAERAAARGETVARDRAVGVLLYAAGCRQIDRALAMGVDEGEGAAAAVVYAPSAAEGETGGERGRGDRRTEERGCGDRRTEERGCGDRPTEERGCGDRPTEERGCGDRPTEENEEAVERAVDRVLDLLADSAVVGPDGDVPGTDRATVREFFDVSDAELAAVDGTLADVVLERVALLDVEK
ncbi:KEOPS complex subunit Cgi121 [Haloparvum sedimenti]|uniref:KEOPS complex subunit Cgi121 n=1 Tax=Haloparvum sedimenti TaxID=1678448 RepID=UPI00071E8EC2|nr:KEOPS complex subunit Cgi121 [Haloparvum sedimenti]